MEKLRIYRKRHAQKRILERHGIKLTDSEYENLVLDIQNAKSIFCFKVSNTRSVQKIVVRGEWLFCVYNSKSSCIVTFLHNGWVSFNDKTGEFYFTKRSTPSKIYRNKNRYKNKMKKYYGELVETNG